MVKLSTARENRAYGPRPARNRLEYINAGLYVLATILLIGGFAAQFSGSDDKSGLVVILIGITVIAGVNFHDLIAHLAGVDYRLSLAGYDAQLALVEFAVPLVELLGSVLTFVGVLFLLIQRIKGYNFELEHHGLNMLIAGPLLWLIGTIHDVCQIYERAGGHVQILQKCVQIPFLIGSLLFLVGGIFNKHDILESIHHDFKIMSSNWIWLCLSGSLLLLLGGFMNVVKVFKMQQMEGLRLEKLRGGAQEWLIREREGQTPLILEDSRRRRLAEEARPAASSAPTPYKDVLVGQA